MQLVSPVEQSPQCWFSSPHYDEASRAWRTEADRWGSLVFAKLHQICQKTTLTQSAVKWLVDPARWHLYLQGRGGHLLLSDQALQHQPLCQSLMGADKKVLNQAENQSNDCSKHHRYLTNEGLSGNGDAGTHRARFLWVDFEIYRLFCSNDGKLDQRKEKWVKGGLSAGPCMGPN